MVQAIIDISEKANIVLNIIKAKHGLRDKSQAIEVMAEKFEENILEPELKPEYIEKSKLISKQNAVKIGSVKNLRERYEK